MKIYYKFTTYTVTTEKLEHVEKMTHFLDKLYKCLQMSEFNEVFSIYTLLSVESAHIFK